MRQYSSHQFEERVRPATKAFLQLGLLKVDLKAEDKLNM